MVKARDRMRVGSKVKRDKEKRGWPRLEVGDAVRGQNPKSDIWDMAGKVADVIQGGRAVFVKFHRGGSRLFRREDVKKDTTGEHEYKEDEEEEHEEEVKGSDLEARKDEDLKESSKSLMKTFGCQVQQRRAKEEQEDEGEEHKGGLCGPGVQVLAAGVVHDSPQGGGHWEVGDMQGQEGQVGEAVRLFSHLQQ